MSRKRVNITTRRKKIVADAQRKFYKSIIFFIVAFLVIVFLFGDHGLYQLYKIKSQRKATQERIEELKSELALLEKEKNRLETDMDYIERLAREKYRMAKPGEKVFKVIPRENNN